MILVNFYVFVPVQDSLKIIFQNDTLDFIIGWIDHKGVTIIRQIISE